MIDSISSLWSMMTIFFQSRVIFFPLFTAMILLNTVFGVVYLLIYIFDQMGW